MIVFLNSACCALKNFGKTKACGSFRGFEHNERSAIGQYRMSNLTSETFYLKSLWLSNCRIAYESQSQRLRFIGSVYPLRTHGLPVRPEKG